MLPEQSAGGGGGFPVLPAGTPGYAVVAVAVAVTVVALVKLASLLFQPKAPAPAEAKPADTKPDARPADVDYQMARETIDRLERQLERSEAEQARIREAYERQQERNHELEMHLAARDNSLAIARDEIANLRATITALQRPWTSVVPPPAAPPQAPSRAPVQRRPPITSDVADPDAITDPIPEARR